MAKKPKKVKRPKPQKRRKSASKKQPSKPKKKRKTRKPTKPVFAARPKFVPSLAPEGFTTHVGEITQDEAYATILARLEDARARLPDQYESRIIIHPYVDGSVDGELYIKVVSGTTSRDTSWDLSEAFGGLALGTKYWMSTGARYIIEDDDEVYRRNRGMNLIETNYQRATAPNITEEADILERKLLPGMYRHYKREAANIFIRLHWNPTGERPKR